MAWIVTGLPGKQNKEQMAAAAIAEFAGMRSPAGNLFATRDRRVPITSASRVDLKNANRPRRERRTISALRFILPLLLIALSPVLSAQQEPEPEPLRFDVTSFLGFRSSMTFPVEPYVTGTNARVVLDASPSYGVAFGMRLREEDLVEVRWARQDSYVYAEDITPLPPRQRVILDQFHGDCSHEAFVEDLPSWARPFVMASVGGTHVSSASNISFTRFSFGIGAGMRFYPTRHLGFKIQGEWVPVLANPQVSFVCGAGCVVHVGGSASSQGEIFVAPFLRF